MMKLATFMVATMVALGGCIAHDEHRNCREHEHWEANTCHTDVGYDHYWDHDDHRDWHPAGDHHDDDHHDDHH